MVWTEEQQDCAGAWWPPVSPRPDTVGLPCLVRSGQQGGGCWTQAGKPSPGKPGLAPAATRGSGRSASALSRPKGSGPDETPAQARQGPAARRPARLAQPACPSRRELTGSRSDAACRPAFCSFHFQVLTFSAKAVEKNRLITRACFYLGKKKLTGLQEMPQNVRPLSQSPRQA